MFPSISSSADSCGSSDSSEGFFFPSKPTEDLEDRDHHSIPETATYRIPLDVSSLNNKKSPAVEFGLAVEGEISTAGVADSYARTSKLHTGNGSKSTTTRKIVSWVYCESAQFYAGNERSTSLVTAIPADIYDSGSADLLIKTTSLLLDKIVFVNRSPLQFQQEQQRFKINTSLLENGHEYPQYQKEASSPFGTDEFLSPTPHAGSTDSLTLREFTATSFQGLSFLTRKDQSSTSSTSAHVHFASPVALINAYTPEYDVNSSMASATDVGSSYLGATGLKLVPSLDLSRFSPRQDIEITQSELAEIELEEQGELENPRECEDVALWYRYLRLMGAITKDISSDVVRMHLDVLLEMSQTFLASASALETKFSNLARKKMRVRYYWSNIMTGKGSLGLYTGIPSCARLSASNNLFSSPSLGSSLVSSSLYLCRDGVD
jgi:hypothetical protein